MLLHEKLRPYRVILASASPRRRTLLQELGLEFTLAPNHDLEETFPPDMPVENVPEFLAEKKAATFLPQLGIKDILITADTVVILNGEILGKPADETEAIQMITRLSGKTHTVITGVCLASVRKKHGFSARSEVKFRNLTPEEISFYVTRYRPFDKAGAYGIQEWIGYVAIEEIRGSFYNVMGLPVQKLYLELSDFIESLM